MMESGKISGFSPWFLESALAGELPPQDMERFRTAVAQNPELAEAVEAMRISNRTILDELPASRVEREVHRRAAIGPHSRPSRPSSAMRALDPLRDFFHRLLEGRARMPMLLSAAAACFLILLLPVIRAPDPDPIRIKGDSLSLFVYRQVGERTERMEAGGYARPSERLQVYLKAPPGCHAAVFALDGRGATTQLWPSMGDAPERVGKREKIPLPNSYELDDAPAFERIFLVSSRKNFKISEAMQAASRLFQNSKTACCADLELPGDFGQASFLLLKKNGT
jgi:hypothetical protein